MPIIHLYHISQIDLGSSVLMLPNIPKFKTDGEDNIIPRICCCTSIPSCISAINNIPELIDIVKVIDLYAYEAYVEMKNIIQPSDDKLPDVWLTGEMWVIEPTMFFKCHHYKCSKQFHIPNTVYSRYAFKVIKEEYEVADRVAGDLIYGEPESFSMLLSDNTQEYNDEAINYYENHPYF